MGSGRRKKKLLTRGDSVSMRVMIAFCQFIVRSIVRVALFAPRVAVAMIAAQFPETEFIALGELERIHPFRGFPEIEMRHKQPRRSAMLGWKGLAGVLGCHHRLPHEEVGR